MKNKYRFESPEDIRIISTLKKQKFPNEMKGWLNHV